MNGWDHLLRTAECNVGLALGIVLATSFAVLVPAQLFRWTAARASAATRYLVLLGLLLMVPATSLTAFLPRLEWPAFGPDSTAVATPGTTSSLTAPSTPSTSPAKPPVQTSAQSLVPESGWLNRRLAVSLWVGGFLVGLVHLALRLARARALVRGSQPVQALAGFPSLTVAVCERIDAPLCCGLLRSIVLVPPDLDLQTRAGRAALAHEQAHLDRWDLWTALVQDLIRSAVFFSPAIWWMNRWIGLEREAACDDRAARAVSAKDTARALVSSCSRRLPSTGLAMSSRHQLRTRIERLLDPDRSHDPSGPGSRLTTMACLCGMILAFGMWGPRFTAAQPASALASVLPPESELVRTVHQADTEALLASLESGDWTDAELDAALETAVINGQVPLIRALLDAGADPNGATVAPLVRASAVGRLDLVDLLIDAGADVHQLDGQYESPLMAALDSPEMMTLLLGSGARVDQVTFPRLPPWLPGTALARSASTRQVDAMEHLLAAGAEPSHPEFPALFSAISSRWVAGVARLLEVGADPNQVVAARNNDGDWYDVTPVWYARRQARAHPDSSEFQEILSQLLSAGGEDRPGLPDFAVFFSSEGTASQIEVEVPEETRRLLMDAIRERRPDIDPDHPVERYLAAPGINGGVDATLTLAERINEEGFRQRFSADCYGATPSQWSCYRVEPLTHMQLPGYDQTIAVRGEIPRPLLLDMLARAEMAVAQHADASPDLIPVSVFSSHMTAGTRGGPVKTRLLGGSVHFRDEAAGIRSSVRIALSEEDYLSVSDIRLINVDR